MISYILISGSIYFVIASIFFLTVINFVIASIIVRRGEGRDYRSFSSTEESNDNNTENEPETLPRVEPDVIALNLCY